MGEPPLIETNSFRHYNEILFWESSNILENYINLQLAKGLTAVTPCQGFV